MRIVLDARTTADHFPGIGRYVANLLAALTQLEHQHTLIALVNPRQLNTRYTLAYPGLELVAVPWSPFDPRDQWRIPAFLRQQRADLFHATYYVRPYWLPCRSVTTLYDLIPLHFPRAVSLQGRLLFNLLHRQAINSSDHLIALSQHAAREITTVYGLFSTQITAIPLAADPQITRQPTEQVTTVCRQLGLPAEYALTLGSNKPHKNLDTLIRTWALLPEAPPLVIAGHWDRRFSEAEQALAALQQADRITILPNLAESMLPALYSGARLFVYPSLYEGFGLPPLEALACGVPVICGNHSSLPEVVGTAAELVDVSNPASLADAIRALLTNQDRMQVLAKAGPDQAARFSWQATAQQTLAVYQRTTTIDHRR